MDYVQINKKLWNDKTDIHYLSEFYDVESFIKGKNSLKEIELDLLGNIKEKSIIHLQCHFGMDTISLSRLGANVTGIDLSDNSIIKAKKLAEVCNMDTKFIQSDIYDLKKVINEKFDIVFTSYGVISWLPDLNKWSNIIKKLLNPGGYFVFVEFHPVIWMFNNEFTNVSYSYFNKEAIIEENKGTYTNREANIINKSVSWNHHLGEVLGALIKNGFKINHFEEFDYSPYNCFDNNTVEFEKDKFQIIGLEGKIPMVYSIKAQI